VINMIGANIAHKLSPITNTAGELPISSGSVKLNVIAASFLRASCVKY
jgi:hypothetical protein